MAPNALTALMAAEINRLSTISYKFKKVGLHIARNSGIHPETLSEFLPGRLVMHIVEKLHGLDGKLSHANTDILRMLLQNAEPHLWHSAKNMIIGNRPIITLGNAVKCVTSAHVIFKGSPDPFTLYRALRFCLEKQRTFKYNIDVCDSES